MPRSLHSFSSNLSSYPIQTHAPDYEHYVHKASILFASFCLHCLLILMLIIILPKKEVTLQPPLFLEVEILPLPTALQSASQHAPSSPEESTLSQLFSSVETEPVPAKPLSLPLETTLAQSSYLASNQKTTSSKEAHKKAFIANTSSKSRKTGLSNSLLSQDELMIRYTQQLSLTLEQFINDWRKKYLPPLPATLKAAIRVTIHRNGTLLNSVLEYSTGDLVRDRWLKEAMHAFANNMRFPPVPEEAYPDEFELEFLFPIWF